MKKYTNTIAALHEEATSFTTKGMEATTDSMHTYMQRAIEQSSDVHTQATNCALVAVEYCRLQLGKVHH